MSRGAGALAAVAAVLAAAAPARAEAPARDAVVHTHLGEVRACHVLPGGDVLVGTGGGLARLGGGGEVRAVWTALDGLPGTRIDAIQVVGGELWIGAERGAARIRVDGARLAVDAVVGTRSVRAAVAHGGARYLATWEGGVQRLAPGGALVDVPMRGGGSAAARARVAALVVDGGTLYAGTAAGLFALRGGALVAVPLPGLDAGAREITALHAGAGALWLGTPAGLYARTTAGVAALDVGDVRAIAALDDGVVVAQLGGGLRRVDRGRLVALPGGPASQLAQAVASGPDGACAGGLDGLHARPAGAAAWRPVTPLAGLPANDISALAVDGERLWVGMFDHGVAVLERGRWRAIASPWLDRRVNALLVDAGPRGRRVWVATATGLSIIEPGEAGAPGAAGGERVTQLTKRDGLPARGVLSLARLADGTILAGTMHGAVIVGAGRPRPLAGKQQVEASNVWAVAQDGRGDLWLGTTTGLYRGRADDRGALRWTRYALATGHLRDDWVMALAVRGDAIYAGTYKGGVTRLDAAPGAAAGDARATGDALRATHVADGWINPGGLAWDGDLLRAATMEGPRAGRAGAALEALPAGPGRDTTALAAQGDTLWTATRRGLVGRPLR